MAIHTTRSCPAGNLTKASASVLTPALKTGLFSLSLGVALIAVAHPALAHHAMGGKLASNGWQGLLSGLAHPVIGLDHLAFVVAIGLLSARFQRGLVLPVSFLVMALVGTGLHVSRVDLPGAELLIASSVVLAGATLIVRQPWHLSVLAAIAAIAGCFHGYAYGESIVGAEPTPLVAYLIGFTLIQLAIAVTARQLAVSLLGVTVERATPALRYCGFAVGAIGLVFLAQAIV